MVGSGEGGDGRSVGARILRRKRVDAASSSSSLHVVKLGHNQLAKTLTVFQLISIGVGSTIGAGVYVLVGTVARERSGPALTLSFLIAAIAAALSAFCYAELASRCPSAGSAYHYSYICIGEGVAWITGWALVLEYTVGGSAVARGISPNLALLFGGEDNLPVWLIQTNIPGTAIVIDPCAAALVILTTFLLCVGVKESVTTQAVVTIANVFILIFVIIVGTIVGIQSGWPGYRQSNGYLPFGLNGMLGGAATVFFAYIGFDTVASTAEEVKNPQRDLPIGIGVSLLICGGLYMMVAAVIVGIVPYYQMDALTPISSAFSQYGMPWAVYVITAGAIAALCSTLLGSLLPQPRILMAMARDGLLPPLFVKVSKKTMIPIHGTLATGFIATLMAFFMDVDQLSNMVSFGTLLAFVMVGASLLIVRYVPPKLGESLLKGSGNEEYSIPSEEDELIVGNSSGIVSQERQHRTNTTSERTCLEFFFSTNQILKGKGTDAGRRWAAAISILIVCIGSVIAAIGACAELLPSWLRWILGLMGLLVFSCAAVVLLLLEQDEGRHVFGHSGGFICPFIPWLPLGSILINIYLLANLGLATWLQVSVWLILGAAIYFLYGQSHSFLTEQTRETLAGKTVKSASPKYGAITT